MKQTALQRTLVCVRQIMLGIMATGLLLGATLTVAQTQEKEKTLLVWAGDKAHEAPDFLAVVDFDSDSPRYGKILCIVPLPAGCLESVPLVTSRTMPHVAEIGLTKCCDLFMSQAFVHRTSSLSSFRIDGQDR